LPLEVSPATHQPGGKMLKLGKLDLKLALMALGPQGKNVQDQTAAVDHPALQGALEIALLPGRQFMIEKYQIRCVQADGIADFGNLALAGKKRGVGPRSLAGNHCQRVGTSAGGKKFEFGKPLGEVAFTEIQLHENRTLTTGGALEHQGDALMAVAAFGSR
jgi:hypothetical protein